MVAARGSAWRFKQGQREKGFDAINKRSEEAERTGGFRGYIGLFPEDDPDAAVIVTLRENEEARAASRGGIFQEVSGDLEEYLTGPPDVKHYRVEDISIREMLREAPRPM
ncbi:MAG: hypothetical protein KO206_08905 [Methanomicrobiaceae archaeon]|nr:hypothetical protein [Methanomicrobiaceae archaeon]